jgi:hypothetical protein
MGAQKVLQEIKSLQQWIALWQNVNDKAVEVEDLIQLAELEEDGSFTEDIAGELEKLKEASFF